MTYNPLPLSAGSFFDARWEEAGIGIKQFSRRKKERSDEYSIQAKNVTRKKYFEELPFRTVLLSPFDMNLLYMSPSHRRDYIDSILEQKYEQFAGVRKKYESIIKNRNALLKNIREGISKSSELDFWDQAFIEICEYYLQYRKKYFAFIDSHLHLCENYLRSYQAELRIMSHQVFESFDGESVKKYLFENRQRDILTGHTHIGPHRDDFDIFISHPNF